MFLFWKATQLFTILIPLLILTLSYSFLYKYNARVSFLIFSEIISSLYQYSRNDIYIITDNNSYLLKSTVNNDSFYKSPLFIIENVYIIYIFTILTLLYFLYRFYYKIKIVQKENKRLRELAEMKNRFYQNITHEMKTSLTVIKGLTEEISTNIKYNKGDKIKSMLNAVDRNSNKLQLLTNQISELSQIENIKLKSNNICGDIIKYLKIITEPFHYLAKQKKIEFLFYSEIDELCMDFDREKMDIIISNLLSNAIKFTQEYGKITLYINKETSNEEKQQLIINIKDTGIGISKEENAHIFERFYQGRKPERYSTEGSGIGLSIVDEYIQLMNGQIKIKNLNKGTIFTVILPINTKADKQANLIEKTRVGSIDFHDSHKIIDVIEKNNDDESSNILLIIEDNKDVAHYISMCVDKDYKILYAKDGDEGIKMALQFIPDIIITDLIMPVKDGFEVCKIIKNDNKTSHIPIIMLTVRSLEEDKLKGYSAGADAYLVKPFSKKELNIHIKQLTLLRKKLSKKYSSSVHIPKNTNSKDKIFLNQLYAIIDKNLDNTQFKSANLASKIGLSESQLYRKVKSITDKSIAIFIRDYRLIKAKEMLKTTDYNISEIAYLCGFNDPAWFSKNFKKKFKISPTQYKNK